jgi:hypothetical protein
MCPVDTERRPTKWRFTSGEAVVRAVEDLAAHGIPEDQVDVFVLDESGRPARKLDFRKEPGTARGALIGGGVGAAVGLTVFLVASLVGTLGLEPLNSISPLGVMYLVGACAATGIPIGAAFGLAGLIGGTRIAAPDGDQQTFLVVVDTRENAGVARRTLQHAGGQEAYD